VRSQVEKYKKLRFNTHENIGYGEIWQEPEEMQTRSLMMVIYPQSQSAQFLSQFGQESANSLLYGVANLMRQLAPAKILCDVRDIGVASRARDPFYESPVLYLYDMYPGGTGIAEALCSNMSGIIGSTIERIASCACLVGCPSCIGVENANPDNKAASLRLLELLSCS